MATTQQLNNAGGYITSTTLYDALLRVRQTQSPTPGSTGIVVTDHFYEQPLPCGDTRAEKRSTVANVGSDED